MANYDSNYSIAQEISARIGVSPIPFDSVYSIALEIYNELGGEPAEFDSVYSILLGILPLVEGGVADKVIDDSVITTVKTWSSSKINQEIQAVAGTANSDIEGKSTEDFHFVTELPQEAEEDEQVVIKGDNTDTLYKYVSGAWAEQTPDANILYFDTENEALYSYVTLEHQFAPVSMVNTIVVGSNLNSNAALKAIKTPGVYSVVQRLHSATKGDYIKNWTLTVEGVDYDEYERTDSVYQRIQSNYTIQKRTWSSTRATNDGWSSFSTYYAGEIKDTTTSKYYTWSSNKLTTELGAKQDALTAGQNISIDSANTISADGYVYNGTDGSIATKYLNTDDEQNPYIATNTASGEGAFAEGYGTTATGMANHAEGGATQATGSQCAHAEGLMTVASGKNSHAEGYKSVASGHNSHAEGGALKNLNPTTAAGNASHAEGYCTLALAQSSHSEGELTEAKNPAEHAQGNCNLSHKNSDNYGDAGNTMDSIGIGIASNNVPQRKNATEVMQNGDMYVLGVGGYQGTNTKVQDNTIKPLQTVISDINTSVAGKQDALTAGAGIEISGTTISTTYEVATTADIEALFTLPSFYVDNTLFETYGNLTWTQWLASRYNTSGFTHIYTASTYDSSVEQIPEVSSSDYPTAGGHYYSTCTDTYVPPTPSGPADNEIFYTTESGELWEPYDVYNGGDTLQIDGNTLLSNTYENGHGVLRYTNNITELSDYWGNSDYDHNTDITSITLPHSITYIGNIMPNGNSGLNTVSYNGTVAECGEIDMSYFAIYADFNINGQIVCTDGIYNMFE